MRFTRLLQCWRVSRARRRQGGIGGKEDIFLEYWDASVQITLTYWSNSEQASSMSLFIPLANSADGTKEKQFQGYTNSSS
uniref:Uncharacterized protein n=1 Tax=Anguilla anguilla TaxID=7936 RepID=A0A0E9WC36_ANGAN